MGSKQAGLNDTKTVLVMIVITRNVPSFIKKVEEIKQTYSPREKRKRTNLSSIARLYKLSRLGGARGAGKGLKSLIIAVKAIL